MHDQILRGTAESRDGRCDLTKSKAPGKDKIILETMNVYFQMAVESWQPKALKRGHRHLKTFMKVQEVGDIAQEDTAGTD